MSAFPFEVPFEVIQADPEPFVSAIFASLESDFLVMPKGAGFVEYRVFEEGYEALKQATANFTKTDAAQVLPAVSRTPVAMIVLRTMLGFTPPEWAYMTTQRTGVEVGQGFARSLDRRIRMNPTNSLGVGPLLTERVSALVETACQLLREGAPPVDNNKLHRLAKADTLAGLDSLRTFANMGAPYAMLLYERFLGRPFAGHRDSVSELVGDIMELAVESALTDAGVSARKTKRAEKIAGFDQTPDFIIPSEFNPQVVIEAKITEDDGTARDKVTRVQHLGTLSEGSASKFEVIACIGGRGFGVRREDMKKLLIATKGKVFTLKTLNRLVQCTRLNEFRTQ